MYKNKNGNNNRIHSNIKYNNMNNDIKKNNDLWAQKMGQTDTWMDP
jgi:hypothetical protein